MDSLRKAIERRDIIALKAVSDEDLNKYSHFPITVVESKWEEGIREYQSRYKCWAWTISNMFLIWSNKIQYVDEMFLLSPDSLKKDIVESVLKAGCLYLRITLPPNYKDLYKDIDMAEVMDNISQFDKDRGFDKMLEFAYKYRDYL